MNCNEMMELMQRYLDADLSASEEMLLFQHLDSCGECSGLFDRLKLVASELEELPKVTPPFSIVDSILPQLEALGRPEPEMGAAAADPASLASEAAPLPPVRAVENRRQKRRWMSWPTFSGAAAAALVLGIFIFQMGGQESQKTADSAGGSAESLRTQSPVEIMATRNHNEGTEQQDLLSDETPMELYAADPSREGPGEVERAISSPASEGGGLADSSGQKNTKSLSTGQEAPKVASEDPKPSLKQVPAQENMEIARAPAETEGEVYGIAGIAPQDQFGPEQEPVMGIAAAEHSRGENTGGSAIPPSVSPDGSYSAVLVERSVSILDRQGAVIFTSKLVMQPGDKLTFVGWTDQNVFTYKLEPAEGVGQTILISAVERKETVQ